MLFEFIVEKCKNFQMENNIDCVKHAGSRLSVRVHRTNTKGGETRDRENIPVYAVTGRLSARQARGNSYWSRRRTDGSLSIGRKMAASLLSATVQRGEHDQMQQSLCELRSERRDVEGAGVEQVRLQACTRRQVVRRDFLHR